MRTTTTHWLFLCGEIKFLKNSLCKLGKCNRSKYMKKKTQEPRQSNKNYLYRSD